MYRVLIRSFVRFIVQRLHFTDIPVIFAGIDLVCSFGALYLFYRVLTDDLGENAVRRVLSIGLFFALLPIPLMWVVPWQRPETLPTTLFLAFSLLCLTKARNHAGWYLPYLAATVVQSFVRSDMAFILALSLVLVSLFVPSTEGLGPRRSNLIVGLLGVVLAVGVQALLQFVLFPHRTYPPGTPVVTLSINLSAHMLGTALHALGIYAVFALFLLWKRPALEAMELLVLLTAALYLLLWCTVGVLHEVRIYVPMMFTLSAVMARVVSRMVASGTWQVQPD